MKISLKIALIASLLSSNGFAADVVTRRSDNTEFKGTIDSASVTEVVLKSASGKKTTIPTFDIKRVRFDKEPIGLIAARASERSGALPAALEKYRAIQKEAGRSNKRLSADLQFLIARATAKLAATDKSKAEEAIQLLGDFRTTHANNFRYLDATLLHADLLGSAGQVDQGKQVLEEVRQSPVKWYQIKAGSSLGHLLLNAGDAAGALQAFTSVASESEGDETARDLMFEGMLGRALCLQKQSSYDQALEVLDEIIQKASESELSILASAWLRKGDCLKARNKVKAALMAYLHVDVLYPTEASQHSEALYQLSKLWEPAGHADRAVEASARLTSLYPNSEWATRK